MKQQDFEQRYSAFWFEFERWLGLKHPPKKSMKRRSKEDSENVHSDEFSTEPAKALIFEDFSHASFPKHYRSLCHQLAVAKHRRYSPQLIQRLNRLALKGHHQLYKKKSRFRYLWLEFFVVGFPRVLRANAAYVWIATAFFVLPGVVMGGLIYWDTDFIYSMMSPSSVRDFESMYDPAAQVLGRQRGSDTDVMMFGFYIENNIGISFRTFASGIFFGVGSLFFLIYNGVMIGGLAGYISHIGYQDTFFPFVIGHGAFELTAIVLCGAAGLKMGFSLIAPGPYRRLTALKLASKEAVKIIYGSTAMLLIAAFLEAFWSSKAATPIEIKYMVGSFFWLMVLGYFFLGGRRFGS